MRRDHDVMRFRHSGHFAHLGDANCSAGVWLNDIDQLPFNVGTHAPDGAHALTGREGNIHGIADALQPIQALWGDRVFVEQQIEWLQGPSDLDRIADCHPEWSVRIHHDVGAVTGCFANCSDGIDIHNARETDLYAHVAEVEKMPCRLGRLGVAINLDFIPEAAPEQVLDRLPKHFSFDVPQRHLDTAECARTDSAEHAVPHRGDE